MKNLAEIYTEQPLTSLNEKSDRLDFAWLELTGMCNLTCHHCSADSSPSGTHGSMQTEDWQDALRQIANEGARRVQFIGGEPTLHPSFDQLVGSALRLKLSVEVFSNMTILRENTWRTLTQPGVSLATSYYSSSRVEHEKITNGNGSFLRTTANIRRAVELGIPIRAGIIGITAEQDTDGARQELLGLGLEPSRIGYDDVRTIGRFASLAPQPVETADELCGRCANGRVAILPDGSVQPCVMARDSSFTVGNILQQPLSEIRAGQRFKSVRDRIGRHAVSGPSCEPNCSPEDCGPNTNCTPMADD